MLSNKIFKDHISTDFCFSHSGMRMSNEPTTSTITRELSIDLDVKTRIDFWEHRLKSAQILF